MKHKQRKRKRRVKSRRLRLPAKGELHIDVTEVDEIVIVNHENRSSRLKLPKGLGAVIVLNTSVSPVQ